MHILHSNPYIKIRNSLVFCYLGRAFALHSEDKLVLLPPHKLSILLSSVLLHTAETGTQGCVYSQTSRSLPYNLYLIHSNAFFKRALQADAGTWSPARAARQAIAPSGGDTRYNCLRRWKVRERSRNALCKFLEHFKAEINWHLNRRLKKN